MGECPSTCAGFPLDAMGRRMPLIVAADGGQGFLARFPGWHCSSPDSLLCRKAQRSTNRSWVHCLTVVKKKNNTSVAKGLFIFSRIAQLPSLPHSYRVPSRPHWLISFLTATPSELHIHKTSSHTTLLDIILLRGSWRHLTKLIIICIIVAVLKFANLACI